MSCTPKIIIADEPTTSLDVTIQAQYIRLLKEIQRQTQVGIIFITHDFGIVARMCDRVAVMYAGRIVEHGPIHAIFEQPSHPYTQALIRSLPRLDRKTESLYSIPGTAPTAGQARTGCPFASRCVYAEPRCQDARPATFPGLSAEDGHVADCWKLEDPSWRPNLS